MFNRSAFWKINPYTAEAILVCMKPAEPPLHMKVKSSKCEGFLGNGSLSPKKVT